MRVKKLMARIFRILSFILLLGVNNALAEEECFGDGCIDEGNSDSSVTDPEEKDKAAENSQKEDSNEVPTFPLEGNIYKDTGKSSDLVKEYNPYSWDEPKSYAPTEKMEKVTRTKDGVVVTEYVIKNDKNDELKGEPVKQKYTVKLIPKESLIKEESDFLSSNYLTALIMLAKENDGIIEIDKGNFLKQGNNFLIIDFVNNSNFNRVHVHNNGNITVISKQEAKGDNVKVSAQKFSGLEIKSDGLHLYVEGFKGANSSAKGKKIDKKKLKQVYNKELKIQNDPIKFVKVPVSSAPTSIPTSKSGPTPSASPPTTPTLEPTPGPTPSVPPTLPPSVGPKSGSSTSGSGYNNVNGSRNKHEKFVHHNEWATIPLDISEGVLKGD